MSGKRKRMHGEGIMPWECEIVEVIGEVLVVRRRWITKSSVGPWCEEKEIYIPLEKVGCK